MQLCLVLAFLLACYATCNGVVSDVPEEEGSRLTGRMDRLESLLVVQANKMAAYDSQLEDLKRQLLSRDRQLAVMADKMAASERSYQKPAEDVSQMKLELRDKDIEMAILRHRIQHLEQAVVGQDAKLHKANTVLSQQTTRKSDLARQDIKTDAVSFQQDDVLSSNADLQQGQTLEKRSDDGGPLEVVVSQLSQQVTQMSADAQAFKTQTASDLQTLKTQTVSDLQAFKTLTASDVQTLKNNDLQQAQSIQNAATSTFVRWGNSQCPSTSDLVYAGIMGGSHYTHSGGATNYLCLTLSPIFGETKVHGNHLYGTEYETSDSNQDKDAVCAVCRSSFTTTIMIPGTNVCTQGWHTQYTGYLMAGSPGSAAGSEFICVDSSFESFPRSNANEDGAKLSFIGCTCGSLPCNPYIEDKTIVCVVCSK